MDESNEILKELQDISPMLAQIQKVNVLKVPDGYFKMLAEKVTTRILLEEKDTFYFDKNNSPQAPEGYFDSLSDIILSKIKKKEEEEAFQIKSHQPAKIISMKTRWWKYAAAAIIAGVIAFGSLQLFKSSYYNNQGSYEASSFQYKTPEQVDEGIASLSDDEIIKYLEKHGSIIDNDLLINGTDVKELPSTDDYLMDENTLNDYLEKIDAKSNNKKTP